MFAYPGECPSVADLDAEGILDPTTEHTDLWDNDFVIECEDLVIHIRSAGPDKQHGTDDDIAF